MTKNHFRISSIPEGIMMFGHKNIDRDNYDINLYFATSQGLAKFPLSTIIILPEDKVTEDKVTEDKVTETEPIVIKQYVPELKITESHYAKTYRGDTFGMVVQAYDGKINPDPKDFEFEGRLDGVDITVLLSLRDEIVTTLKGITSDNGFWNGKHYFDQKSSSGKYSIDISASYGNQTVSKSTSMIVSSSSSPSRDSGGNQSPVAEAGPEQLVNIGAFVTLDGSASSDPEKETLTFSWEFTSVPVNSAATLSSPTTNAPTFTADEAGDYNIQLTVTDPNGLSDTDSVLITAGLVVP